MLDKWTYEILKIYKQVKYLRKLLAGPLDGSARPGGARPFGTGGLYNNKSYIS